MKNNISYVAIINLQWNANQTGSIEPYVCNDKAECGV